MFDEILAFFATPVWAQSDYGLYETAKASELTKFGDNLPALLGSVIGAALSLVGVLFFALMLYGGITWMLAHGNAEQEKKALSTITAAIIGILIVLGSYALTSFVFSSMKGAGGNSKNNQSAEKKCASKSVDFILASCTGQPTKEVCEKTKLATVSCKWDENKSPKCYPEKNQSEYCGALSASNCNTEYCELK